MKILKRVVTNVVCLTAAENYKKRKKTSAFISIEFRAFLTH